MPCRVSMASAAGLLWRVGSAGLGAVPCMRCTGCRAAYCRQAACSLQKLSASALPRLSTPTCAADQEVDGGLPASWDGGLGLLAASPEEGEEEEGDRAERGGGQPAAQQAGSSRPQQSAAGKEVQQAASGGLREGAAGGAGSPGKGGDASDGATPAVEDSSSGGPGLATPACPAGAATASAAAAAVCVEEGDASSSEGSTTWQTVRIIWAPMAALSLSSAVALTLFPFFTYVPTSGLLGESLPKVSWRGGHGCRV